MLKKVLVTGAAGFIGFHTAKMLLEQGREVLGIDNLNDYYDPQLKLDRLKLLERPGFEFRKVDLADAVAVNQAFADFRPDGVINLGAQAGVRYSLENPAAYVQSNLVGFGNILESCRHGKVKHLVYASSSSVYGLNQKMPLSTADPVDHPVSLYAATKKSNEMMAHTYSHLFDLPATGLRFFTVYGPWGRPDMSPMIFAKAILAGTPIQVFNHGKMRRDFTYVDDIVTGVVKVLEHIPSRQEPSPELLIDPSRSPAPFRIFNIGNNQPIELMRFIEVMENEFGREAIKEMKPMQPGDVLETFADTDALTAAVGFKPSTPIEEGVRRFADWYRTYFNA